MAKSRNPDDKRRWKNLCDQLAEDALNDPTPLTQEERAKAVQLKKKILDKVQAEVSEWGQKETTRRIDSKPKYIN